jgi:hypothetical protein
MLLDNLSAVGCTTAGIVKRRARRSAAPVLYTTDCPNGWVFGGSADTQTIAETIQVEQFAIGHVIGVRTNNTLLLRYCTDIVVDGVISTEMGCGLITVAPGAVNGLDLQGATRCIVGSVIANGLNAASILTGVGSRAVHAGDRTENSVLRGTTDCTVESIISNGIQRSLIEDGTSNNNRFTVRTEAGAAATYAVVGSVTQVDHTSSGGNRTVRSANYGLIDTSSTYRVRVSATGIAFNGAAIVARPTLNAAATDLATTTALLNQVRTALINYGLTL